MSTTTSGKKLQFWLGAAVIVALALGVSANRSDQAAAAQANLQRARAADQARWNAMAARYAAAQVPVSAVRGMPHPGLYRHTSLDAPIAAARGMPHPGLYQLWIGS